MRAKGICYDTGFFHRGTSSREPFDPDIVKRELRVIAEDLHCTAVRVLGGDPDRLEIAANHAADCGLEVWFSPFTCDLSEVEMLALLADCAERAERLRQRGAPVVFVAGGELSLLNNGFLPGDTLNDRIKLLGEPARLRTAIPEVPTRLNEFFRQAIPAVRQRFGGTVTYAAIQFENVDWSLFDIVSFDHYRSAEIADRYREGVRALVEREGTDKPAAITECGTATYRGAGDRGARARDIIEWDEQTATPLRLSGEYARDEAAQAAYLRDVLEVYASEGVDSTFVYTFADYQLPHRPDGDVRDDLDLASCGVVKVLEDRREGAYPGLPWEPKAAFTALAEIYGG